MNHTVERMPPAAVYGIEVPEGVLRVRMNGKECWTGNSGRGTGAYTQDQLPAKGGETGAKRIGGLLTDALLSHGACLFGSTSVHTDKGYLEISKIVKQRLEVNVMSASSTGVLEYKPVTDWMCRCASPGEIRDVRILSRYEHAGKQQISGRHRALKITTNHSVYTQRGKILTADLKVGDTMFTIGPKVADWQLPLLIGMIMGDAHVSNRNVGAVILSSVHGHKQYDYNDWKYSKLSNLGTRVPTIAAISANSFAKFGTSRFILPHHGTLKQLHHEFYDSGDKQPPEGIVARMGLPGIAVWFADDGSSLVDKKHNKPYTLRIHTCAFTLEKTHQLADELKAFTGFDWRVTLQCKKYPILMLTSRISDFIALMRDYLPPLPAITYKFRLPVESCGSFWTNLNPPDELCLEPAEVMSITDYVPKPYESYLVYNITVKDNHNYIAHGALVGNSENLRDTMLIRGSRNDDYWTALKLGRPLPEPGTPFIFEKFQNLLRAGGVSPRRKDDVISLMPMTDKEVDKMAEHEISGSGTVDARTLEPVKGGLFDAKATGGVVGRRWGRITLHEPMPNPVMAEPIRRLLGLKQRELEDVVAGDMKVGGMTGGAALQHALEGLDVDKEMEKAREETGRLRGSARDDAVKRFRYLNAAKKQGVHPSEWMITKVPVLPPVFRPVSSMGGVLLSADMNDMYRDLIESNNAIKDLKTELPGEALNDERRRVYGAVKAAYGLDEAVSEEGAAKGLKGALRQIIGNRGKYGLFQAKLTSRPVDTVGRATATPDPELDMDTVGIPEKKAWEVFAPFVLRRLVKSGIPPVKAKEEMDRQSTDAKRALHAEMLARPVMIDRAPGWWKFNVLAQRAVIVKDDTMHVSPLIGSGFNLDFDGDAMNFHVPVSERAVKEAWEKMLPSRNLFKTTDKGASVMHSPGKEMLMGLWKLTGPANEGKPVKVFNSVAEARAAYHKGEIDVNDPIEIRGKS